MVKKEITTCEQELAKRKIKAEKRHQVYLKNKKPKGASKKDEIIALKAEVAMLKKYVNEEWRDEITQPIEEVEATPFLEEITQPIEEEITQAIEEEITQPIEEEMTQPIEPTLILDETYIKDDNFIMENPLKKCFYKESIYNLEFFEQQINELNWETDAIRDVVMFSLKNIFPLMAHPQLPTCVVCLDKLIVNLDHVETDNRKKKIFFQSLMVLIQRLEIELKPKVIQKYMQIYSTYEYMALNYRD